MPKKVVETTELAAVALPEHVGGWLEQEELEGGPEGLRRVFQLGPALGMRGSVYVELQGNFTLYLAIPGSTKISADDRASWDAGGSFTLANQTFESLNKLQNHVRLLLTETKPGTRLQGEDGELLMALFAHHPWASEKLKDVQGVEVWQNQYDASQNSFYLMRSESEGDDISYVKCIRALNAHLQQDQVKEEVQRTETLEVLAAVHRGDDLDARLSDMRESLRTPPETVGMLLQLENHTCALHVSNWLGPLELGPAVLRPARRRSKVDHPVFHIVDVPARSSARIRFKPPFELAPPGAPGFAQVREDVEEMAPRAHWLLPSSQEAAGPEVVSDSQLEWQAFLGGLEPKEQSTCVAAEEQPASGDSDEDDCEEVLFAVHCADPLEGADDRPS